MSASREKKQRTGDIGGLTQKQIKEAKEIRDAKRNKMLYGIGGAVVVLLISALLVWDSGFFQKRGDAATIGDTTLSVAEMQYYYGLARTQQYSQEMYMQQLYTQMGGMTYTPTYDIASNDTEQIKDAATGETWAQYFKQAALESAKQTVALLNTAKTENYTLSAEGKAAAEEEFKTLKSNVLQNFSSFSAYLKLYYGPYIDEGTYRDCAMDAALANEYYTKHQESLTYTEDDLKAYAAENASTLYSYDFRYYAFNGAPETKQDADGNDIEPTEAETTAAKDAAKAQADELIAALKAASDKAAAFDTALKDIVVPAADAETEPAATAQTNVMGSSIASSAYYAWLTSADRKSGDVSDAIESGSTYYVVLFEGSALDESITENVRHILVRAEAPTDDAATADVDESQGVPTQEALDAAKAKAQTILDEYNAGEKTEDAFAALANKYSEDTGSNTVGGLYTNVEKDNMVANFDAWIFDPARVPGETGIVDNVAEGSSYYGYHVMFYVGQGEPKWQIETTSAKQSADMTAWMTVIQAPYSAAALPGMAKLGL